MAENKIELKSVEKLLGMSFYIPNYQRGYRWTKQQVSDVLNDIWEFSQKVKTPSDFYCLQPLVIKKRDEDLYKKLIQEAENRNLKGIEKLLQGTWDIIDGQQRLTTIYIILTVLDNHEKFTLRYETRSPFEDFLNNIMQNEHLRYEDIITINSKYDNIDFYHIFNTYHIIKEWFNEDAIRQNIKDVLLSKVKFIWYESVDEDPIKVFTRLNIGKIPLTNAELIKALLLNSSNFNEKESNHLRLCQQEIASEWDNIEYTLQNDEFWLFLHQVGYDKPTRIDFIFNLIVENKTLGEYTNIGTDDYRTFRYFNEYFSQSRTKNSVKDCWREVKKYFQTFQEWFNDLEMFHYVGFLVEQNVLIQDIYHLWEKDKTDFIKNLKDKIREKINRYSDLNLQYELEKCPDKKNCKCILLLHNIQSSINQNTKLKNSERYGLPIFYKFPFHLFKKEDWDVEHIDSNTENELENIKDQKEWLKYSLLDPDISNNKELRTKILNFINNTDSISFENLSKEIEYTINVNNKWDNPTCDKNKIWNFVLLDAGTNRGYGNAIFPAKRRSIIGRDQGKKIELNNDLEISENDGKIAFVPPVTKNVFLKYYNTSVDDLKTWTPTDAEAYKLNIYETLKEFGVILNKQNNE